MIESAWRELDAPDAGNRDGCLEVVADILERGLPARADAERVAGRLVAVALSDEGYALRESALHALSAGTTSYEFAHRALEPLAAGADRFEPLLLEYVLYVLGCAGGRSALPVVERFLHHPAPEVRREAAEAARELHWRLRAVREGTA
ncbi:hypothetical protein ACIOG8_12315 [Streptomyces erythrochromogenes]|uniref:hypothetical protein n=1 Tax=Streptomyces erythrochromogenes TaxID=285574 RepID=UPI003828A95D